MARKTNARLDRIFQAAEKAYVSEDIIFVDVSVVRRVRRKALQMQGQLSLHFMGVHYQQCLDDLGLWSIENPGTGDEKIYLDAKAVHQLRRKILQEKGKIKGRSRRKHYQSCLEELGLWNMRKEEQE